MKTLKLVAEGKLLCRVMEWGCDDKPKNEYWKWDKQPALGEGNP